ncbi:uncharacterized protein LOC124067871 isoform X2 [Xyrichtys novacula]|nr:uncharacterized protein LOC124067871 isoform X2 [Xyrichtys novacula]
MEILSPASQGLSAPLLDLSCGRPAQPFFKGTESFPSSPHPGGRSLPCSLPCSPLLRGRLWRSSSPSSNFSSSLSRLWVEEALQRSKNLRQSDPHPHLTCSTQVRQEGEEEGAEGRQGETPAEEEQDGWSDGGEEGDEKVETVSSVGIRMSDTVIFRPVSSTLLCGGDKSEEEEEEEKEEDSQHLSLDSDLWRYCLLSPCVCERCPSAPPFEAELVSAADLKTFSSLSSEGFTQSLTQRMEGDSELRLPTNTTPQLGKSSSLYPSLSLWRSTPGHQNQEVNTFHCELDHKPEQPCYHGNKADAYLQQLIGEPQTCSCEDLKLILQKVFDSAPFLPRTVCCDESCSSCSKLRDSERLCRNCKQVNSHLSLKELCGHSVCVFVSLDSSAGSD